MKWLVGLKTQCTCIRAFVSNKPAGLAPYIAGEWCNIFWVLCFLVGVHVALIPRFIQVDNYVFPSLSRSASNGCLYTLPKCSLPHFVWSSTVQKIPWGCVAKMGSSILYMTHTQCKLWFMNGSIF